MFGVYELLMYVYETDEPTSDSLKLSERVESGVESFVTLVLTSEENSTGKIEVRFFAPSNFFLHPLAIVHSM